MSTTITGMEKLKQSSALDGPAPPHGNRYVQSQCNPGWRNDALLGEASNTEAFVAMQLRSQVAESCLQQVNNNLTRISLASSLGQAGRCHEGMLPRQAAGAGWPRAEGMLATRGTYAGTLGVLAGPMPAAAPFLGGGIDGGFPEVLPEEEDLALPAALGHGFEVAPPEWPSVTTVMMRNIPNKYTQRMLLTEINCNGFLGSFDYLYLPIDPETNANRGYAFLNFIGPNFAWMFKATYEGNRMNNFNSNKVVSVVPATLQGFEANYAHYASARVNRGDPSARPLFLREPTEPFAIPRTAGVHKSADGKRGDRQHKGRPDAASSPAPAQPVQRAQQSARLGPQQPDRRTQDGAGVVEAHPGLSMRAALDQAHIEGGKGTSHTGATRQPAAEPAGPGPMVPKFCPDCGGSIRPTFQFCPQCGASLNFSAEGSLARTPPEGVLL